MNPKLVSVVIPVFNDLELLSTCLECLDRQTYPKSKFEVLVVDNGSDLPVQPIVDRYSNMKVEKEPMPGSYAARNRGIAAARGEILAFTDADCRPSPTWLEMGVKAVASLQSPGLVVGRIDIFFTDPQRPTWVELYEREFGFPQRDYATVRHFGATANVFTVKAVFEKVGVFNADLKSGGDFEWGNRVYQAGLPILYADEVRVAHPARRDASEFFAKLRRTVRGHYDTRHLGDKAEMFKLFNIMKAIVPPRRVLARIGQSGAPLTPLEKIKIAGFLVASRHYTLLVRLRLALFGDKSPPPR